MARQTGWLPRQHGAWAMLAVPSAVGLVQGLGLDRQASSTIGRFALVVAFWLGYFAFDAATLWLKARPNRRAQFRAPVLVYGAAAAVVGVVAVVALGPALLWWGLVFGPLSLGALWLARARRERSVLSGGLTVAAASLLAAAVACPDPRAVTSRALWTTALAFAYFFGTVYSVKTMIRERGSRPWWVASVAHHVGFLVLVGVAVTLGVLHPVWLVLPVGTLARAAVLPRIGPFAQPPRTVRPAVLGAVEIGFSLLLLVWLLVWPPA